MNDLELYSKVESLLGIEHATKELHSYYFSLLEDLRPKTLLDVGCGDGAFIAQCKAKGIQSVGIDLSSMQVAKAKAKGLSVACQSIEQTAGQYDVITIIFDVVNFIHPNSLQAFFSDVERLLTPKGRCIFDINTLYGFEEVAQGVMVDDHVKQTLIVDAQFDNAILKTDFTLFTKEGNCYTKEQETITQYYHTIQTLLNSTDLKLSIEMPITLYGEEPDKAILLFTKE